MAPGSILACFIFFATEEWAQAARVFDHTRLERLARDKRSSLLGPFVSYKKMECCVYSPCGRIHNTLFSL